MFQEISIKRHLDQKSRSILFRFKLKYNKNRNIFSFDFQVCTNPLSHF